MVRIRNDLQPEFENGLIYALREPKRYIDEEKNTFPQSNRMDVLDVLSTLIRNSIRPISEEEEGRGGAVEREESIFDK